MKICINYWGQLRDLTVTANSFNKFIKDDINEFYILLTTWENEPNINEFIKLFPNAYVHLIKLNPDISQYSNILINYKMDDTNHHKSIEHYILGLYIKKHSENTIEYYENKYQIKFDIIICMRTDIYIKYLHLSTFYNYIFKNNNNIVYTPKEPCFDVYNEGALPDVLWIGNKDTIIKTLHHLDILESCKLNGSNQYHPETSFYKSLVNLQLNICKLPFYAFPQDFRSKYDEIDWYNKIFCN